MQAVIESAVHVGVAAHVGVAWADWSADTPNFKYASVRSVFPIL